MKHICVLYRNTYVYAHSLRSLSETTSNKYVYCIVTPMCMHTRFTLVSNIYLYCTVNTYVAFQLASLSWLDASIRMNGYFSERSEEFSYISKMWGIRDNYLFSLNPHKLYSVLYRTKCHKNVGYKRQLPILFKSPQTINSTIPLKISQKWGDSS